MYWSAGALKEKEVELWNATKEGLERWSAVTPGRGPFLHTGGWRSTVGHIRKPYTIPEGGKILPLLEILKQERIFNKKFEQLFDNTNNIYIY